MYVIIQINCSMYTYNVHEDDFWDDNQERVLWYFLKDFVLKILTCPVLLFSGLKSYNYYSYIPITFQ